MDSSYLRLTLPGPAGFGDAPDDDALERWESALEEAFAEAWGGCAWMSGEGFAFWIDAAQASGDEAVARAAAALEVEPATLLVGDVSGPADWREKWRRSFLPLDVDGFRVVPPWLLEAEPTRPPAAGAGAGLIVIDPAAGFGTGQHETTRLMLRAMRSLWRQRAADFAAKPPRVLDVGSGSGVLAIATLQLGAAAPVAATEIDPDSERNARENFELNGVAAGAVDYRLANTLAGWGDASFDVVLCNMLCERFYPLLADMARLLAPGGALLLSGYLGVEEEEVVQRLAGAGLAPWPVEAPAARLAENDWRLLIASRARP